MAITKKKNGKYQVRVYVGTDKISGKQQYTSATASTMREARLKEAQFYTEVENGDIKPKWEVMNKPQSYTFDMAYNEWFELYSQQGLTDATVTKTQQYFNSYLLKPELFGGLYFDQMTRKDIQDRVNQFIPTLVSSKKILSYARQVFKYAVDSEHIKCDENILEHIRTVSPPKPKKRETKYYNEKQAKLLDKALDEYFKSDIEAKTMIRLLLHTGMRIGEADGLQWENINYENDTILLNGRMSYLANNQEEYLSGLKNGDASRLIECDKQTMNFLRIYEQTRKKESLLNGEPIKRKSFVFKYKRQALTKRLNNCIKWFNENHTEQLPHLNVHGLRHTHASLLISNGVELKQVGERLGHKDITVTANIYADVTPKARREVADKFSAILGDDNTAI